MVGQISFLSFVLFVPPLIAFFGIGGKDGRKFAWLLLIAGIFYLGLLWFINNVIPYAGGGDDEAYFLRSGVAFSSIADWFDFGRFSQSHEQPGYPLVLAWVRQLAGDSLFVTKAVNVFFFLCLAIVWFSIGKKAGGPKTGYIVGAFMLVATPLWFYWMFLLKDMAITLIQSIFLLGTVGITTGRNISRNYIIIFISTIALIPFRVPMVVINLCLLGLVALQSIKSERLSGPMRILSILSGVMIIIGLLALSQDMEFLRSFGIETETRRVDVDTYAAKIEVFQSASKLKMVLFPVLFLFGETTALNPGAWARLDAALLRGITMLPWIVVGVPLFLYATYNLAFRTRVFSKLQKPTTNAEASQGSFNKSAWFQVFALAMIYVIISWLVGDTTRWRIPGLPAMVALAALGWIMLKPDGRYKLFISWMVILGIAVSVYYIARQLV